MGTSTTCVAQMSVGTSATFGDNQLRGLGVAWGRIYGFFIDLRSRLYNTLALPCECVIYPSNFRRPSVTLKCRRQGRNCIAIDTLVLLGLDVMLWHFDVVPSRRLAVLTTNTVRVTSQSTFRSSQLVKLFSGQQFRLQFSATFCSMTIAARPTSDLSFTSSAQSVSFVTSVSWTAVTASLYPST